MKSYESIKAEQNKKIEKLIESYKEKLASVKVIISDKDNRKSQRALKMAFKQIIADLEDSLLGIVV